MPAFLLISTKIPTRSVTQPYDWHRALTYRNPGESTDNIIYIGTGSRRTMADSVNNGSALAV